MTGAKAKKTGGSKETPKKHYCACSREAKPVMLMPGRRIVFECEGRHRSPRSQVTVR